MTIAISTNGLLTRLGSSEAVVDAAHEMGFRALELGFNTRPEHLAGFRARLDEMPVTSVHAFCPVPVSAPAGHPELYTLASPDAETRKMAALHVRRTVDFAAEIGATAVVLHAGHACANAFFSSRRGKKRAANGAKLLPLLKEELAALEPFLAEKGVTLGLENLPCLEGFPNEDEISALDFPHVGPWFDTGHDYVRRVNGWTTPAASAALAARSVGFHINDSVGGDDHLPPGEGNVDFAALAPLLRTTAHLVFEPNASVTAKRLVAGRQWLENIP